jgi:hypothetical protein
MEAICGRTPVFCAARLPLFGCSKSNEEVANGSSEFNFARLLNFDLAKEASDEELVEFIAARLPHFGPSVFIEAVVHELNHVSKDETCNMVDQKTITGNIGAEETIEEEIVADGIVVEAANQEKTTEETAEETFEDDVADDTTSAAANVNTPANKDIKEVIESEAAKSNSETEPLLADGVQTAEPNTQSTTVAANHWSCGSIFQTALGGTIGSVAAVARYPTIATLVAFGVIQYFKHRR